jgi:hypothetical protein
MTVLHTSRRLLSRKLRLIALGSLAVGTLGTLAAVLGRRWLKRRRAGGGQPAPLANSHAPKLPLLEQAVATLLNRVFQGVGLELRAAAQPAPAATATAEPPH